MEVFCWSRDKALERISANIERGYALLQAAAASRGNSQVNPHNSQAAADVADAQRRFAAGEKTISLDGAEERVRRREASERAAVAAFDAAKLTASLGVQPEHS